MESKLCTYNSLKYKDAPLAIIGCNLNTDEKLTPQSDVINHKDFASPNMT